MLINAGAETIPAQSLATTFTIKLYLSLWLIFSVFFKLPKKNNANYAFSKTMTKQYKIAFVKQELR
jgi:hypothetical protein